ncbi:type I secretion system permease/ATPase [Roseibium aestuarii]|uniref:Type I secretion system permease/ATPase n=1 Tax=Roseibium aestuarii TaxID=2600299 RepID=A0ABW4JQM2_9HYPH|nr:type I secretion system permease/ATPase [Roseibium aestuarii]
MRNPETWRDIRKHFQEENRRLGGTTGGDAPGRADETASRTQQARSEKTSLPAPYLGGTPTSTHPNSWKIFRKATGEIRRFIVAVAFFSFVINVLVMVSPIFTMQVYDRVLSSGSLATLFYLALAATALMAVSAMLEGVRSRILVRLGGRFDDLLSGELFTALVRQSSRGTKSSSLSDLDTLRGFLTGSGLFFFFDAPWTPLFLGVMLMLHPLLFGIALAGAGILFTLALISEGITRKPLTESAGHFNLAKQFAGEVTSKVDTVEAMGMSDRLRERWQTHYQAGLAHQARASDHAGVLTAISKFVRPALQIALLGSGAYLALNQQISAGAMIASSIIMGRALAPVEGAISNWRSFIMARAAYSRIRKVMKEGEHEQPKLRLPRPAGDVSVERLEGAPPGCKTPVIKGISFAISQGEALGVVGPSASGKSTLARLLVGVWPTSKGAARIDGSDVCDWDRAELGPHVGYLSQAVELFDGTIAQNIARFGDEDPEAIIEAAREAGVHDMILHLPNGYNTVVGPSGSVLSGGQRQRIGLARALYGGPAVVVLDEPYSNLDDQGERALKQALSNLKARGTTVVIIAHRPSILHNVDKVLVLRDGLIDQFGPAEVVLANLYRAAQRAAAGPAQGPETPAQKQATGPADPRLLASSNSSRTA